MKAFRTLWLLSLLTCTLCLIFDWITTVCYFYPCIHGEFEEGNLFVSLFNLNMKLAVVPSVLTCWGLYGLLFWLGLTANSYKSKILVVFPLLFAPTHIATAPLHNFIVLQLATNFWIWLIVREAIVLSICCFIVWGILPRSHSFNYG